MKSLRIAIIGAGMAGISAALALAEKGHTPILFDKSGGSGGRMCSKRTEFGELDIGAQYFTARDPRFSAALQDWVKAGCAAPWTPALYRFDERGLAASPDDQRRYAGVPRMTALSRHLLRDLVLNSGVRVVELERGDDGAWSLCDDQGNKHGVFDRVVVAIPAAQAVPLLSHAPTLTQAAEQADMAPCWTVVLTFAEPLETPVEACFVRSGPLDWISRHLSKPGRTGADSWVLQSTAAWAEAHLQADQPEVAQELTAALSSVLGQEIPEPTHTLVHRWLYARADDPRDWGALAAPELGLYACGDWCSSGRLEGAWLSGKQVADSLI